MFNKADKSDCRVKFRRTARVRVHKCVTNIWVVKTKKNEMGRACGMYGGTGEMHREFWWGDMRERVHLED